MATPPSIAILLGTFNGERFLAEQLESIMLQIHTNWTVYASDDCSSDSTCDILKTYREKWGGHRLSIRNGPAKGWVANFLSIACDAGIEADYFAFADQDDIWDSNKLETAVNWLQTVPENIPALYCARTRLIDETGAEIGLSPLFSKPLSFRNALVQSVAGGNTMVFNQAARTLLCEAGSGVNVQTHDWWAYIVVSGCGGRVVYDASPTVRYRQHGKNIVGSNADWAARATRIRRLFLGHFRQMNDRNILALERIHYRLSPENQRVVEQFNQARNSWLIPRTIGIKKSGIYHHSALGALGLIAATLFKRL